MGNVDALSSLPLREPTNVSEEFINFCSVVGEIPINKAELVEATMNDAALCRVMEYVKSGNWPHKLESLIERRLEKRKL